jgi:hypothetical protein
MLNDKVASGAKARIFGALGGTAEAVPFPKPQPTKDMNEQ